MNFTVNINAPELSAAIIALANALEGKQGIANVSDLEGFGPEAVRTSQVQVVPEVPQQTQVTPIAVPTAQYQAPPVQQLVVPTQGAPVQQSQGVPTSAPSYSMDQLAIAATQLVDAGKREDLLGLLASFGVQALTALPKEQYGVFATKLRELGAKI